MQPKACISSSFCSSRWLLAEPVAGLARRAAIDAGKRQPIEQLVAEACAAKTARRPCFPALPAPRSTGVPSRYGASAARSCSHRQRIELFDAARSPRRRVPALSRSWPARNRSCPCTAARASTFGAVGRRTSGITRWNVPVAQIVQAAKPPADAAAGSWASSPPAACASGAAPAGAARESTAPAWWD